MSDKALTSHSQVFEFRMLNSAPHQYLFKIAPYVKINEEKEKVSMREIKIIYLKYMGNVV